MDKKNTGAVGKGGWDVEIGKRTKIDGIQED
jgi:hypothetical protein